LSAAEYPKLIKWLDDFEHINGIVAIRPDDGEGQAEVAWQYPRGVPECPSPLYDSGRLYLVKNGGVITCLDATNGELLFTGRLGSRGPHYASPVLGDGKIYCASAAGEVVVVEAGADVTVLARNDLGERIMATPALVDGVVYVRSAKHLFAFADS
jgi:outer membrane protein assembly factor BamB